MIFTEKINEKISKRFDERRKLIDYIYPNYCTKIDKKSEDISSFLKFYYAYMPVEDMVDYPMYFFEKYAEDSAELYEKMQERVKAEELKDGLSADERDAMFLNYVACHRTNNEDFFHSRMFKFEGADAARLEGLSDCEKVKEINYWCSEHVTYQASDERTMSAVMTWMNGVGRCGEESVFLIEVLRSNGFMARQVYAPFWAHCDDNHAWVEVFVDGAWHYLGACEPEETLNKGWFTSAAKRAVITRALVFSDLIDGEEVIGRKGTGYYINTIGHYARTNEVEFTVLDEAGNPVPDCEVHIQLVNYASYLDIAEKKTGADGKTRINLGISDVNIRIKKGAITANYLINTGDAVHTLVLKDNASLDFVEKDIEVASDNYDFDGLKPEYSENSEKVKTKKLESTKKREDKIQKKLDFAMYKYNDYMKKLEAEPEALLEAKNHDVKAYFEKSYANIISLITFLNLDGASYDIGLKMALLDTLSEKDFRDFEFDYLYAHLKFVRQFVGTVPDEAFIKGILPIRIANEYLGDYVSALDKFIPDSLKAKFKENPFKISTYIDWLETNTDKDIKFSPDLYMWAESAFKYQLINGKDKDFITVAIARTIGVPAYLRETDKVAMLYVDGKFVPMLDVLEDEVSLVFDGEPLTEADFSISLIDGALDRRLELNNFDFSKPLKLARGRYRLVISTRLPNGNSLIKERVFDSENTDEVLISKRPLEEEAMYVDFPVDEFNLEDESGAKLSSRELLADELTLFIWLKSSSEPSEHIINELKAYGKLSISTWSEDFL